MKGALPFLRFAFCIVCFAVSTVGLSIGVAGIVKATADMWPAPVGAAAGVLAGAAFLRRWVWPRAREEFLRWEHSEREATEAKRAAEQRDAVRQAVW